MSKQNELAQLADAVTVDGSSVGIGTSSYYPLTVQSGTAGSNHALALRNNSNNFSRLGFLQSDSTTAAYSSIDGDGRASGYLKFNTNDTERLRIDSDGLKFHGDTAAANALNDYEEGTWTPQLNFGFSDNGITYTSRVGRYTKIGRMVYASFNIALSNKGSVTGTATISGIPFTHFVNVQHSASNLTFESNGLSANQIGAFAMPWNDGNLYLRYQGATAYASFTDANFNNSTVIFGIVTYETTS